MNGLSPNQTSSSWDASATTNSHSARVSNDASVPPSPSWRCGSSWKRSWTKLRSTSWSARPTRGGRSGRPPRFLHCLTSGLRCRAPEIMQWEPHSDGVRLDRGGRVAVLRLDRPTVLNALTVPMLQDLAEGIRRFGAGESSEGVILTGTGRAFSSGDDLKETEDLSRQSFARLIDAFQDVTRAIVET